MPDHAADGPSEPDHTLVRDCEAYAIAPPDWWPAHALEQPVTPASHFISVDVKSHLGAAVAIWLGAIAPPPHVQGIGADLHPGALAAARIGIAVVGSFTALAGNAGAAIQTRKITLAADCKVCALTNRSRPPPQSAAQFLEMLRALP